MSDDQARDANGITDEAVEDLETPAKDTNEVAGGIIMVEHTAIGSATGGAGAGRSMGSGGGAG
jgi:hypothetical protein